MDTVISPSVINWEFISYNTWILVDIFTMVCLVISMDTVVSPSVMNQAIMS